MLGVRGRAIAGEGRMPRWASQTLVKRTTNKRMRMLHRAAAKRLDSHLGDQFRKVFVGPHEVRLDRIADVLYDAGTEKFTVFLKNSTEYLTGRYLEVEPDGGARVDLAGEIFSDEPGLMDPSTMRGEQMKSMLFGDEASRKPNVKSIYVSSEGRVIKIKVDEVVSVVRIKVVATNAKSWNTNDVELKEEILITTKKNHSRVNPNASILIRNENGELVDSYRKGRALLSLDFGVSRFSASP